MVVIDRCPVMSKPDPGRLPFAKPEVDQVARLAARLVARDGVQRTIWQEADRCTLWIRASFVPIWSDLGMIRIKKRAGAGWFGARIEVTLDRGPELERRVFRSLEVALADGMPTERPRYEPPAFAWAPA